MADYNSGLFTNPDYATPEQVAQMRAYAAELLKPKSPSEIAPSWTGALAAGLQGFMGGQRLNQANQLQRQLLQQGQQGIQGAAAANPYAAQLFGNPTSPQASNNAGAGAQPRGIRNNNPGNIEDGPFAKSIPGYQGSDGRFAVFDTPEHGQQAMDSLLSSYGKRGLNTPNAVINRWAPPGENNSTAYAATVAKQLGVDPNAPMNMADPAVRQQLGQAITGYENGGQRPMPTQMAQNGGDLSAFYMNPSIPNELKESVRKGNTPVGVEDVQGRQGYTTVMGGPRLTPQGPGFTQGYRGPFNVTTPGATVSGVAPYPAGQSGAGGIAGPANAAMDVAEKIAGRGAAIGATVKQTGEDIANANASIPQISILKTMRDTIKNSPTMQFGITAPWLTNLQMMMAQHAPDMLSTQQIHDLAAANSVDKLTAQLGNILSANGSSTDAKLFNNLHAIPGRAVNSKEGMLDLIDMIIQQQGINHQFVSQNMNKISQGLSPIEFQTMRNKFYEDHPIINPATHNPIKLDLQKSSEGSAAETKIINGKTYTKINGKWHEGS